MVNLPIEYSDKPVTPYGGMSLMKRFLDQTGIKDYLGSLDLPAPLGLTVAMRQLILSLHFG
ncbi:hypothetical protein SAMN04488028_101522 [Reichenbachiella agariperforans]|uniref:Uncharacterized protein n=1 Tax=Reichenbachiella agariperforans TaxID=156994 RepID=A0A1M6KCC4_REIAG|nr:hypothetical protein [Reichenbachiella agariperforans]SHJ56564.1 hypothetical protein SAMN04488028_101522 [Reichenbachiella agariperforans]